jgi:exoribonuclease R
MHFNANGQMTFFRFTRATVRIAEVIAYEEAQARIDEGRAEPHLVNLWGAWKSLEEARKKRDPSTSNCPSGAWCWTRRGASPPSPCANVWTRIAWSRIS